MRLAGGQQGPWQNRAHFFALAAHSMRQVLMDHARRRHADKRGGAEARKVEIDSELFIDENKLEDVIAMEEELEAEGDTRYGPNAVQVMRFLIQVAHTFS